MSGAFSGAAKPERFQFFPLYPSEWLSDPRIMLLSIEQEFAFFRLLLFAWKEAEGGGDCTLPDDDIYLSALCRMDVSKWTNEVKPAIMGGSRPVFQLVNGRWVNKRLTAELKRAKQLSKKRKAAADARWGKHVSAKR